MYDDIFIILANRKVILQLYRSQRLKTEIEYIIVTCKIMAHNNIMKRVTKQSNYQISYTIIMKKKEVF